MSVRRSSIRGTFFPNGVPNILRIFRTGGAKYSRIFCAGVQKIGETKYPMTPGSPYSYDYRDPGPHIHMNMGTRGPHFHMTP